MMLYPLFASTRSPELIVWAACIGIIVALIISFIVKKIQGGFVSALIEKGALDTDRALTVSKSGASVLIKMFLKKNSSLYQIVSVCEGTDANNPRFYIKEEHLKKAESFSKGIMKWYMLPIFAIATLLLAYAVILLLPYLI